ncbi:cytosine permease [Salmonella enterica]|uniref:cytosine permease n=1 Tax=Salmonella enterica TaxID=28901 RepID=UPI0009AC8202|nr:cytosine permease [Salmonella enterica]EGI9715043.1 cytosine permease [Salmonella enterica]
MSQDNNYSQGPVPLAARKGVIPLTFVMLGLTFFSASMWTGGTLGTGLTYHDFFLAVLFGNLLLGIYTAFLGYIGAKTGLSTHLLARYSFGVKGSWLPSLLLGGTQVGWFGVGVAMFAIPVSKATGIDANILIAVSGLLMTLTIFFGISALTILSIIAVPAIVILGSYSVWLAVSGVGGLEHLKTIAPQTPLDFSSALSVVNGIIGTVCALWLYNNFVGWLTFLSSAIPPIGGVIIADYLLNRRRYADFNTVRFIPVNWIAILSVALGIAAGHYVPGIVPVNAVLGGVFSYILLNPLFNRSLAKSPEVSHAEQ